MTVSSVALELDRRVTACEEADGDGTARVRFDHVGLAEGTAVVLGLPRKDADEDVTDECWQGTSNFVELEMC